MFFGSDGGLYRTDDVYDSAISYQTLNNHLGITQFYAGCVQNETGRLAGGTQDNGTITYANNADSWRPIAGGDGGYCAWDQTDPRYFYGTYQHLSLFRSADGGQSLQGLGYTINDNNQANFIAPIVLDPNNPNTLYAGTTQLWQTQNARSSTDTWRTTK